MARRMKRRDSFRRITKVKAEEYAREMKRKHEECELDTLILLYNSKDKRYKLVEDIDSYLGKPEIEVVGNLDWGQVKKETGRDSIQAGGDYIRLWIDKRETEGKTRKIVQKIRTPIKVNGKYVDTPFRTGSVRN